MFSDSIFFLKEAMEILKQSNFIYAIDLIKARAPILKLELCFPYADVSVDINCNNIEGIYNSHLLYHLSQIDERFQKLAVIVKEWAKARKVLTHSFDCLFLYYATR